MKKIWKKVFCLAFSVCLVLTLGARPELVSAEKYKKDKTKQGYLLAKDYDYSKPVAKGKTVGSKHWGEAAIFGDSRTEGLFLYTDIAKYGAKKYCDIGLNCQSVLSKKFIKTSSGNVKALSHLKSNKKSVKRVYFLFGLNELVWKTETFIKNYKKLISEVRKIVPQAEIYVQSVLPVTKSKNNTDSVHNNSKIKAFNAAIRAMCKAEKLFYIDFYSILTDSEGNLPEGISSDGIHFDSAFTNKWLKLLSSRTVELK